MKLEPAEVVSRPLVLTPRVLAEVRGLHNRTAGLARGAGNLRGRQARRERRDAREAESDLLRVLGFGSYEQFVAAIGEPPRETTERSVVQADGAGASLDAQPGEPARLRVSGNGARGTARSDAGLGRNGEMNDEEVTPGIVEDLHSRVAAAEEELAETRFELMKVRDELRGRRDSHASPAVDGAGLAVQTAAGLVEAVRELRSLCELLREERTELVSLGERGRVEAERIVAEARLDAQREREEAAVEARLIFVRAQAEAAALTRNANSTVEGLRRLALETGSDDSDDAQPGSSDAPRWLS
jgi:hypothetical protein